MSYQVLARKWRPLVFADVVGQEPITRTLLSAIRQGRVAHAYLFTGSRGIGKTSLARIFAKSLRCHAPKDFEPCNECSACRDIMSGNSVDVLEIDGASNNSVDNIRDLRDGVSFMPSSGRYKIYIIDEVHMLTQQAFNALLKTLEEPPAHVIFIFATTEPHKIPVTILSRCQRFDFKRISQKAIHQHLVNIAKKENVPVAEDALALISRESEGAMRDSLSMLDQVLSFTYNIKDGEVIQRRHVEEALGLADSSLLIELLGSISSRVPKRCFEIVNEIYNHGYDMKVVTQGLANLMRDALVLKLADRDGSEYLDFTESEIEHIIEATKESSPEDIQAWFRILVRGMDDIARSPLPKTVLEMYILKLATMDKMETLENILSRLESGKVAAPVASRQMPRHARPRPQEVTGQTERLSVGKMAQQSDSEAIRRGDEVVGEKVDPDWEGFVSFVKRKKPILGSALERAFLVENTDDRIVIFFPDADKLLAETVTSSDNLSSLMQISEKVFGRKKQIEVTKKKLNTSESRNIYEKKQEDMRRNVERIRDGVFSHEAVAASIEQLGLKIDRQKIVIKKN